jgi:hypothetical protein
MASISEISIDQSKKWFEKFARFGLAAKGVVYCLMGILTVMAAFGLRSEKGDKTEAFKVIYDQPFGKFLLILVGVGLLGYVVLRFMQAFMDIDDKGNALKALVIRAGYAISGFLYFGLCLYAWKLALGRSSGGDSRRFIVSKVLAYSMGDWIIGITAVIVIIGGINQIYKGISGRFMKKVQLIKSEYQKTFRRIGVVGYGARGFVFCIIGYFLIRAALDSNPSEAQGTDAAFDFLQHNFGNILMAMVAVGLLAYGIFMFVKARHERIRI